MADIVERLREAIGKMASGIKSPSSRDLNACLDAGDEILNLRIELRAKETEAVAYLRAVGMLQNEADNNLDRAVIAEARIAKLEKALKDILPMAEEKWANPDEIEEIRAARAALDQDGGANE